jgi:hypothetical protein
MSTTTENSFGARLRRAQDLATFIARFNNYAPPRFEESIEGFQVLINKMIVANEQETTILKNYNAAVTRRQDAFHHDAKSLHKLLAPIRSTVIAQYGKGSIEFSQTDAIISQIRSSKVTVRAATDNTLEMKYSYSQKSFGSTTQFFSNLITTLQTFTGYSAQPDLQLPQLTAFRDQLTVLNDAVANNFQRIKEIKENRRNLYIDLLERATRIKAYVKATYGTQSQEFLLVRGLKF